MQERRLIVEAVSVEAVGAGDAPVETRHALGAAEAAPVAATVRMFSDDAWHDAALVERAQAKPGQTIAGPAIVVESNATTVIEPGWAGSITALDHLVLERVVARPVRRAAGTTVDPVLLEVFNNLFMNIAEQMGLQLQNTAYSVNIKERLDFSCALFDAAGNLIANAPHMPVHLGSMSESIKTVIARNSGTIKRGDVYALNDPYHGGTHLPDVTVVTPVYLEDHVDAPTFYVGSRGHHADIGGTTPGSMPPFSTRIEEEGVQFDNVKLVEGARFREEETRALLESGTWPSRNPAQNIADLKAQVAANEKGARELAAMVGQYGLDVVQSYMRHVQDNAEESVRRVITKLRDGSFTLPLDNGARISVAIRVDAKARNATIDFTGTSAQLSNNFNAPTAVCMAAVLYVFRTLVDDEIPLNAGCLKPLEVIIPAGSMLNPHPPASVVAGNVETSTCITNALFGALGVMASSQCTMNNFTFGNARHQYYETIAGGSGAGLVFDGDGNPTGGFDGTSVVQTHMTNSRLTDPEVLEFRFPVRLDSFELRAGSGGAGRWRGGDGGVRRVRFLEPMTASILSNGRHSGAFGIAGGAAGLPGINRVERADGTGRPPRPHRQRRDGAGRRVRDRDAGWRGMREGLRKSTRIGRDDGDTAPMTKHHALARCLVPALAGLSLLATVSHASAAEPALAPFGAVGPTPQAPWHVVGLPQQTKPFTAFSVVEIDGKRAVKIVADESYGNLVHPVKSMAAPAHLAWSWRVEKPLEQADLREKRGDDTAVKVCVFFDMALENVTFADRQLLRFARSKTTEPVPTATICYVWDQKLPAGTALDNAFTRRLRYIVVESGNDRLDKWVAEKRDLGADFTKLFSDENGTAVPPIVGIAVGADSDNTKAHSVSYVSGVVLEP